MQTNMQTNKQKQPRARLAGTLPADWGELKQLEVIRLDQLFLSGPLPEAWGGLERLSTLTLWDSRLNGSIPASWCRLSALQHLDLSYNSLTGALPECFAELGPQLAELLLDVNQFEGAQHLAQHCTRAGCVG